MSSEPRRRLPLGWLAGLGLAFAAGAGWSAARRPAPTTLTPERHAGDASAGNCRAALLMTALARASAQAPPPAAVASEAAPEGAIIDDETAAQAAFFADVAAAHEADTADLAWSRRGEDEIGQLVAARAPAFVLDRVDCRSRTCAAHLHALAREGSSDALEDLVASVGAVFPDISVDLQPAGGLIVYLARADAPP